MPESEVRERRPSAKQAQLDADRNKKQAEKKGKNKKGRGKPGKGSEKKRKRTQRHDISSSDEESSEEDSHLPKRRKQPTDIEEIVLPGDSTEEELEVVGMSGHEGSEGDNRGNETEIEEVENDGLNERHIAVLPIATLAKTDSTRDLMLVFSDRKDVRFKDEEGAKTLKGRWCTICREKAGNNIKLIRKSCERLFSASKQVATDRRSRLGSDRFEELLVMKSAWRGTMVDWAAVNTAEVEEVDLVDYVELLEADKQAQEWEEVIEISDTQSDFE